MYYRWNKPTAFSLVELSIVLVILGLLTGGILAGKSLIESATNRKQLADFQAIRTAHFAFKDKYFCIPGDCSNTSTILGTTASYDGNADGLVQCWLGAPYVDECKEYFYSMTRAGMLGLKPETASTPEMEYYSGAIGKSIMYVHFKDRYNAAGVPSSRAIIHFIKRNNPWANGGIISPQAAWEIDTKYDDGLPGAGLMRGVNGTDDLGNAQTCQASSAYILTQSDVGCRIDVIME